MRGTPYIMTREERDQYHRIQADDAERTRRHEAHYRGVLATCHAPGRGTFPVLLKPRGWA